METVKIVLFVFVVALMLLLVKQGRDRSTQLDLVGSELQAVNAQLDLVRQNLPRARASANPAAFIIPCQDGLPNLRYSDQEFFFIPNEGVVAFQ